MSEHELAQDLKSAPSRSVRQTPPMGALVRRFILIAAVAGLACALAMLLGHGGGHVMLLWPAAGIAFGFGWRYGSVWAFPAAVGVSLWAAVAVGTPELVIAGALVTLAGPGAALALLRRFNVFKPTEYRLDAALRLLVCMVLISAPLNAALAAFALHTGNFMPGTHPIHFFLAWWLIDSLGSLLLAPAVVAAGNTRTDDASRWLDIGALGLTLLVVVLSLALASFGEQRYAHAFLLFFIPVAALTSIRSSERTAAATLIVGTVLVLETRAILSGAADPGGAGIDPAPMAFEVPLLLLVAVMIGILLQAVATDRRLALRRVRQQTRQDMSTGLLNDRGFLVELGERLADQARPDYGLVGLHIANVDTLNDLCGTLAALQMEQSVARLLQRQPEFVAAARLTAGRYALLVKAADLAQVRAVARDVYSSLSGQMFRTPNGNLRLQACVGGLYMTHETRIDSESCLVSLSDAQSIAASVREPQLFVEPLSQSIIDARRAHQNKIENIRESIRNRRFELHAQPILHADAPPDKLSYEILTRLLDAQGKLIHPPEFMALAVQAQMTPAMDRGVITRVFEWLAANPMALARTHKCSINLSGLTMSDGLIAAFIREKRQQYGIPAERIVFEITESEAIRNPGAASRLVDELKAEGFGIALDDFGVGLATFEYLKRFPLDFLKIDGSFIRNLATSDIDEEIVLSTVRVARRLNIQTVAEHVQSADIYSRCQKLGVGHFQGEHLGAAIPIETFFRQHALQPT